MSSTVKDASPDTSRPHAGRRAVISREDLIAAALTLVGPHRSVSTLSLREVARAAGIAPNSFYRHFRDVDELAVALINQAGEALRQIIGEARTRAVAERSVVQSSIEAFMEQLRGDQKHLHLLLREGTVGSDAFKGAVETQLCYFEEELCRDLVRLAEERHTGIHRPEVVARAITRLVFTMGATAMDQPEDKHPEIIDQLVTMVRMIILGTQTMAQMQRSA
ncbi:HTH-type transcriptional repressor FabR [Isoalcanivorax indicus]|uniref:HTH-type transcriptional repressor FabR n=1 Tax=Isoalcanivorax indicus TaxID=2202653 RepID=UPI000DBACDBB|nr:HTH-type transcriptional repressor FabR [Isoalcanivorax indicus]